MKVANAKYATDNFLIANNHNNDNHNNDNLVLIIIISKSNKILQY